MSEAHPDADLVKVTRTTTTYEPAATQTATPVAKRQSQVLLWMISIAVLIAIVGATWWYMNGRGAPAMAHRSAAASYQGRALAPSQLPAPAQQGAQAA